MRLDDGLVQEPVDDVRVKVQAGLADELVRVAVNRGSCHDWQKGKGRYACANRCGRDAPDNVGVSCRGEPDVAPAIVVRHAHRELVVHYGAGRARRGRRALEERAAVIQNRGPKLSSGSSGENGHLAPPASSAERLPAEGKGLLKPAEAASAGHTRSVGHDGY